MANTQYTQALVTLSGKGADAGVSSTARKDKYQSTLNTLREFYKLDSKQTYEYESAKKKVAAKVTEITSRDLIKPRVEEAKPNTPEDISSTNKKEDKSSNKAAKVAKREVLRLEKNISTIVKKFKVLEGILKDISKTITSGKEPGQKLARITSLLSSGGDAFKEAEAELEEKPGVSGLIPGGKPGEKKSSGFGLGALLLALPLLFSPEFRDRFFSFFNGFLEGLGLTNDTIKKVKFVVGGVIGALGAVFTVNALGTVVAAFEKMKELASVLGLAGEAVAEKQATVDAQQNDIDLEKNKTKAAGQEAKKGIKKTKSQLKAGKKLSFWKKLPLLLKKITPSLISLSSSFLKALPLVGTVLGIGMVLWDVFNLGKDVFDFFFGSEEKEDDNVTREEAETPSGLTPASSGTSATPQAEPIQKASAPGTSPSADASKADQSKSAVAPAEGASTAPPGASISATTGTSTPGATPETKTTAEAVPPQKLEPAAPSAQGKILEDLSASVEAAEQVKQNLQRTSTTIISSVTNIISPKEESGAGIASYSVSVGR